MRALPSAAPRLPTPFSADAPPPGMVGMGPSSVLTMTTQSLLAPLLTLSGMPHLPLRPTTTPRPSSTGTPMHMSGGSKTTIGCGSATPHTGFDHSATVISYHPSRCFGPVTLSPTVSPPPPPPSSATASGVTNVSALASHLPILLMPSLTPLTSSPHTFTSTSPGDTCASRDWPDTSATRQRGLVRSKVMPRGLSDSNVTV
mmetsp:Transcript_31086/g.61626  ORF Transcript_31086/g.61626 Transcript_31086/m.61626 type:complete len:201 (-) Transcript_31086:1032-1634(-)